ncbi:MAG: nucleoside deaminase [Gammaproteobacteria bacterium]|nr:nucleoside deaminase [Gammaproteobacteria bacterium]
MNKNADTEFLREAVKLAIHSVEVGGGPFGAAIVKDNKIIGRGHNQVTLNNDPTAHAEVNAIRNACNTLNDFNLNGCTIYTSCEPCPMCIAAIYWARIDRVVYASTGEDAATAGFDDTLIASEICKPYNQRVMSIEHQVCADHLKSFEMWLKTENKTEY